MTIAASAAERMDAIYRRQRYIYDMTRRYYLFGRDRMISVLQPPRGSAVLEVGCGTARNLICAAKRYPEARFYGLDVSEVMLQSARASIARAGLQSRITVAQGDATSFDPAAMFGVERFERVFISYALSMIPPWRDVLRRSALCVAPSGKMLITDFGEFEGYPSIMRSVQLAWLRRFSVTPIPSMERKIGMLAEQIGFTVSTERLYGGYAIQAQLKPR
jgi:S-adenosylmethionine-diacylgycerolhomoserine-N-methlytransferase